MMLIPQSICFTLRERRERIQDQLKVKQAEVEVLTKRWHEEREQIDDLNVARERLDRYYIGCEGNGAC